MIAAVTMVRDEADIVEHTIRHMAAQVDVVVVADNLSVDGTRDIIDGLANELDVIVLDDPDPRYQQSRKMTGLARFAAEQLGATWIAPFDADEIWYSLNGSVGELLAAQPADTWVVRCDVFDHIATGTDSDNPNPVERMTWRNRDAHWLGDVACRWHPSLTIKAGNHGARYEHPAVESSDRLGVRHFSRRTPEQMVRGVRNGYESHRLSGLPRTTGAHYWDWGELLERSGEQAIIDLFHREFYVGDPTSRPDLIDDPAPFFPAGVR